MTYAVIAGGGTAGHVVPGLAIARALVERGHDPGSLHFVGSRAGIEARLVPAAGFRLTALPGRGIQRRLTAENLAAAAGLSRAVGAAMALLRRERPRVVVSVGGFASVPCALAAATLRVPIVVHEQNAVPGAANRLVAPLAKASAVSYPGTALPRAVVTGNPVRPEVLAAVRTADRAGARAALDLPADRQVVAVFGGSLGAMRLNVAVLDVLGEWAARDDLALHHVVGERDWQLVTSCLPGLGFGPAPVGGVDGADAQDDPPDDPPDDPGEGGRGRWVPAGGQGLDYRAVRYEDRMADLLVAADLFVCRAGGNTVAELAVAGAPAVLVPLPGAPGDHQTANAMALAGAGAAVVVPDAELDGRRLAGEAGPLLSGPERLAGMARAAHSLARPEAADHIAALVEEHARG
ncbi:MAG: UDP-N-acetylglucosamine--N-acetylmuramyl-(pentapeptide) pyrophosphoryl-undecaprenol N-acetylglucosamine transferase [Actinomycetota bacterium]